MKCLTLFVTAAALLAQEHSPQVQDRQSNSNQDSRRGQTRPADPSQSWTRGRLGAQGPLPGKPGDFSGMLIDASCNDRTALNLHLPPESLPEGPKGERGAAQTPPEVTAQLTPDTVARQADRTCAVTGGTKAFALFTADGRLLNLDEGGNTMIVQGLHSIPAGRAMLNGTGPGIKPQASIRGRVQGDRLIVDKLVKM